MGMLFVLLAILCWGVGDFLIQRSARKLGDWEALFFITLFATVGLFPFVYPSLSALALSDLLVLSTASIVILFAALLDFDALRVGKISIIEPIYTLEIPITVALATLVLGEHLSTEQLGLIGLLLIGIFLVTNKRLGRVHARMLERGVFAAILATIGMGASNFLFGFAARATGPLMINWFTSAFMVVATLGYLLYRREGSRILRHWRSHKALITGVGIVDNAAWIAFSTSMLYLPIGIATGLTESYVVLAAMLGITLNRERLALHQKVGLVIAIAAATALAFTVES